MLCLPGGRDRLVFPAGAELARTSNSMDTVFCADCLEDGLREHCKPEVFNSDQGSQFTSEVFT